MDDLILLSFFHLRRFPQYGSFNMFDLTVVR